MTAAQNRQNVRLQRLASDLATSLHLRSEAGDTVRSLADLTGLTPSVVAGLIAIGRRALS